MMKTFIIGLVALVAVLALKNLKTESGGETDQTSVSVTETKTKEEFPIIDSESVTTTTEVTTIVTENTTAETTTTVKETTTTVKETTPTATTTPAQLDPEKLSYIKTLYVNTKNDNLRMRKGPSYSYDIVFKDGIPKGTKLDVYAEAYDPESGESWAYVSYGGYSGWCTEKFMSIDMPKSDIIQPSYYANYNYSITAVVNDLNFRTGPGKNYKSMGKINKGTKLSLIGYQSDPFSDLWIFVEYNGNVGWIMTYDSENPYIEFD